MDKCKFLRQKKQVQINGEWVDTRSYRYILYCDGGTPCMIFKGGTPHDEIKTEDIFGFGSQHVSYVILDNNGNQYIDLSNQIEQAESIYYMKFFGKTLDVIEFRGCVVSFLDTYPRDEKGPATDTLIISCSTYGYKKANVYRNPYGFSCKKIIFRGFDIEKIPGEHNIHIKIFSNSKYLESIEGLSNFNNPEVTDMSSMFYGCSSLKSLDISGWNTSNVIYMNQMFEGCSSLTSLDLSNFNTSNVASMINIFKDCIGFTSLDISGLNISNFDTSNVENMSGMFYGCSGLTSLDVSHFDTSNVFGMDEMFRDCIGLTSLNLRNFHTSNATDMGAMFSGCSGLTSLDLSNFDTSNVSGMCGMFADCTNLTSLNVSGFKLPNIKFTNHMFENCIGLTSLDLSGWNAYFNDRTDIVGNMNAMFKGCTNLKFLDLSGWYVSAQIDRNEVFMNCSSLETLDLSGWRSSNLYITNKTSNFKGCDSLKTIYMRNCEEDIVRAIKNELKKDGILDQVTIITE